MRRSSESKIKDRIGLIYARERYISLFPFILFFIFFIIFIRVKGFDHLKKSFYYFEKNFYPTSNVFYHTRKAFLPVVENSKKDHYEYFVGKSLSRLFSLDKL